MDDVPSWLALARVAGLGPAQCRTLLDRYGDPRRLLTEAPGDPEVRQALPAATFDALARPDWPAVERDLAWLAEPGHHVLTPADPRYPALLRQIPRPPLVLFVDGDPAVLSRPQLAIVGSRNPTAAGRDTAHAFAHDLARHGLVITSGLATGIDGAAHEGTLEGGGPTVAVTATGPDRVYPARHAALAGRIRAAGALVTEFPPGQRLAAGLFPRRNRIISGLSLGTLVVEANPKSGSLITARAALEQGREVFAIPGSIHNPCARGCHALIRQGAKLVECTGDILEELEPLACAALEMLQGAARAIPHAPPRDTAAGLAVGILEKIDFAPTTIDTLTARTGQPAERLYPVLLDLELSDLITQAPGGGYMRRPART